MATTKSKRKQKEAAGSNQEAKRDAKSKSGIEVTAVTTVDSGPGTAPATVEKTEDRKTQPAPKKPTVPGVRPTRTRPYLAGLLIAQHGLAAGVTDAMVAELDEAYGHKNPRESRFCLRNAFHAVRGYMGIAEDATR